MNSTNERIYRSSDVIISLLSVLSKDSWKIGEIFNEGRSKHNLTNGIDKLSSYRESSQLSASRFSHHPVTVLSARYRVSQGVACNPWLDNCRFEWIVRRAARISSARAGNKTREALYSQRRVKHRLERATSSLFHVERPVRLCKRDLAISRPTSNTVFLDLATRIVAAPMFNRFNQSANTPKIRWHLSLRLETRKNQENDDNDGRSEKISLPWR